MKTLVTLCLLIGITQSSFGILTKDSANIVWVSKQYTDQKNGAVVEMANEFTCTKDGLSWSLFGGDLPVVETIWNLNDNMTGNIVYRIQGDDMAGTIRFEFQQKKAFIHLNSEVGLLDYVMSLHNFSVN